METDADLIRRAMECLSPEDWAFWNFLSKRIKREKKITKLALYCFKCQEVYGHDLQPTGEWQCVLCKEDHTGLPVKEEK